MITEPLIIGSEVAKEAADSHENNPNVNLNLRNFTGENALNQADQTVDLLNNIIGRNIGNTSQSQSMKKLANNVLECFYQKGLYVASKNADGSVSVIKEKISKSSYDSAKRSLNQLNKNGFTPNQQERIDIIKERELQSIQITWGTMK